MLGSFVEPLPDELLYSAIARFQRVMAYPGQKQVLSEVFGSTTAVAVIDLPGHLQALADRIPGNGPLTSEHLLASHTLLPFYAPFLCIQGIR